MSVIEIAPAPLVRMRSIVPQARLARLGVAMVGAALVVSCGTEPTSLSHNPGVPPALAQTTSQVYLHGTGAPANPATLFLDNTAPTATTAKYRDAASVNFAGGNAWKSVGTWVASPSMTTGSITALGNVEAWLGLKNSDDIGTRFDVRAEASKNGVVFASGELRCVSGLTRNPDLAALTSVAFEPFVAVAFNGTTDSLRLTVSTRIGTTAAGAMCGGHSNATGLRMYFDAASRAAAFSATVVSGGGPLPPIPDNLNVSDDSTYFLQVGGPGEGVYRRLVVVRLEAGATGPQFQAILDTYSGQVVGGSPHFQWYVLRLNDPGPTIDAVEQRALALAAMPGVAFATGWTRLAHPFKPESRFPSDGTGLQPADWLDSAATTSWAMRAIRAPQAWGCQTGLEGDQVRVSFLELGWKHNADLDNSTVVVQRPDIAAGDTAYVTTLSGLARDSAGWHGMATVGSATARGANARGVAGVAWQAHVTVHALTSDNGRMRLSVPGYVQALNALSDDASRVVNVSIAFRGSTDPTMTRLTLALMRELVAREVFEHPERLWIKNIPNIDSTPPALNFPSDSVSLARVDLLATALMHVRRDSASLRSRIMLVGGVARILLGGEERYFRAPSSMDVPGQADLFAPASNVALLGDPASSIPAYVPEVRLDNGNSFATSIVTGAAVLLLSRDPSLSTAELHDLLVLGSTWPRRNPSTGFVAPPVPAAGTDAPMLDVYGALARHSNSRPGSPLCGSEVGFVPGAVQGAPDLRFFRSLVTSIEVLPRGIDEYWGDFSAAQGGRTLSLWLTLGAPTFSDVFRTYTLNSGVWSYSDELPKPFTRNRYFLERDTAYVDGERSPSSLTVDVRGPNAQTHTYSPAELIAASGTAALPGGAFVQFQSANVAPDATRFVAELGWFSGATCGDIFTGHLVLLVPFNGSPPTVLDDSRADGCTGTPLGGNRGVFDSYAAWRDDGRRLWLFHRVPSGGAIDQWGPTSGGVWAAGPSSSIPGVTVFAFDVSPDAHTLVSSESRGGLCRRVYRASLTPAIAEEVDAASGCAFLTQPSIRLDTSSGTGKRDGVQERIHQGRKRGAIGLRPRGE